MSRVLTLCSAAAVLAATGAFAQMSRDNNRSGHNQAASNPCACMEQGMGLPTEKKCFPAAYNAPASIAVSCGWDFDISASFLYWYVSEEGLDAARAAPSLAPPAVPNTGAVAYQDFSYKPGFQVAVGYNTGYDDWTASLQYTWMHQSVSTTATPRPLATGAAGTWLGNDWFVVAPGNTATTSLSTGWKMHMDMLDLFFSRPYYQGTQLTLSPYGGIRALWIRQAFNVDLTDAAAFNPSAKAKSNSWAIGAATGVDTHWLLGMGFRFEGNATGALLYTQYTTIAWKQSRIGSSGATASTTDYSAVRPMAQLGLGLGYGSYLYCQKFYVDFSARYDFNYFWSQNVMRPFVSELAGNEDDRGDLSMHGLTLNARFDF